MEGDSVVVEVEVGWVLSHEDVTKDEVVETFWEIHRLDTEQALTLHLEHVVFAGENVVSRVDLEGQVWKGIQVRAIGLNSDSVDHLVNDSLWSNQQGSSGVDDSFVLGGINSLGSL